MNANKANGPLCGVQYAVFGVRNSIYRTYNATAKYVNTRLHELGGARVCQLGLGDVSKGIEVVFAKWESQLLQTVSSQPKNMSASAPVTAREPPTQPSLPCVTVNAGMSISETVATPADLELPREQKSNQRRYSSATTILRSQLLARRGTVDPGTFMPPLTDRR